MNYQGAYDHIIRYLQDNLSPHLQYHDADHTIAVIEAAEDIGRGEGISERELTLVKTAALFHDVGFVDTYTGHEEASVKMARQLLPGYDYTEEEIDEIASLIMVTKM